MKTLVERYWLGASFAVPAYLQYREGSALAWQYKFTATLALISVVMMSLSWVIRHRQRMGAARRLRTNITVGLMVGEEIVMTFHWRKPMAWIVLGVLAGLIVVMFQQLLAAAKEEFPE
jgi:hypothetical protein